MTLSEFVTAEWKPNTALAVKKSSMRIYGFQLDRHILPALGSMPLRDINRAQIEVCLSDMKRKGPVLDDHGLSVIDPGEP
jgi:hypothetical protein